MFQNVEQSGAVQFFIVIRMIAFFFINTIYFNGGYYSRWQYTKKGWYFMKNLFRKSSNLQTSIV